MKQLIDIDSVRDAGAGDPVSDMLTRIRNATQALHDEVAMPTSNLRRNIARLLEREGYINSWREQDGQYTKVLILELRYTADRRAAISGLRRVSKPGRRVYMGSTELPRVLGGLGVSIVSTSRGVMTSKEAAGNGVGGEVLCSVW